MKTGFRCDCEMRNNVLIILFQHLVGPNKRYPIYRLWRNVVTEDDQYIRVRTFYTEFIQIQ